MRGVGGRERCAYFRKTSKTLAYPAISRVSDMLGVSEVSVRHVLSVSE